MGTDSEFLALPEFGVCPQISKSTHRAVVPELNAFSSSIVDAGTTFKNLQFPAELRADESMQTLWMASTRADHQSRNKRQA